MARLSLPLSFKNDMIIQQDESIQIWGWATTNKKVDISFNNKVYSTIADIPIHSGEKIRWQMTLPPMSMGGPYTMKIQSDGETIEITNIQIANLYQPIEEIDPDKFSISKIFSNHMVLQRDMPIKVWGRGKSCTTVNILFNGKIYNTEIGTTNQWLITLPKMTAGGPYKLQAISNEEVIEIEDILIGDVWLCTGQSNMEWTVSRSDNAVVEISTANQDKIRHFKVPYVPHYDKKELAGGEWQLTNSNTVGAFTAVGYNYAKELYAKQNVPIGILNVSNGGRRIDAWLGPPSHMYETMVYPVQNFSIKGILFYQGESHALHNEEDAINYRNQFRKLIKKMRTDWNLGNIPFIFIQIAAFKDTGTIAAKNLRALVRESQTEGLKEPNTAEIITIDLDSDTEMHPTNKQDVGIRASIAARKLAYNEDIISSGPTYQTHEIDKGNLLITFDNVADGLKVKNQYGNDYGFVKGFSVSVTDTSFLPAKALIVGKNKVVLKIDTTINTPIHFRYAWSNNPNDANLYNSAGLPTGPFRTDSFKKSDQIISNKQEVLAKSKKNIIPSLKIKDLYMSNVMFSAYTGLLCTVLFALYLFVKSD